MAAWNRVRLKGYAGDLFGWFYRETEDGGRVVFDGVTTGTASVSSATAQFTQLDVNKTIFGSYIPLGTTITAVSVDGQTASLSQNTTVSAVETTVIVRGADLSGYTWESQLRSSPRSETVLANFFIDTTNAAAGELALTLSGAVTAELPATSVWDLQGTLGSEPTTPLKGVLVMEEQVTR